MPRPALTRSRIVSAGIALVGESGLDALTLGTVARRVRATPTGVQRHISATELIDAVVSEIVASMPPVPSRGNWSRKLGLWAVQTREWLTENAGLAGFLLANLWDYPVALDRLEALIELLEDTEPDVARRVESGISLFRFVLGSVDVDQRARITGAAFSMSLADGWPERWPQLSGHLEGHWRALGQAQFTVGFDLLIKGIERRSAERVGVPKAQSAPPRTPLPAFRVGGVHA